MRQLLMRLTADLPCKVIKEGDVVFLERCYIGTLFGVTFYTHRFLASDPDRGLHDHPWRWALSLLLCGWYLEERRGYASPVLRRLDAKMAAMGLRQEGVHTRQVHWVNWLRGDDFHRVVLPYGVREVWTLFMHRSGPNAKPWGFLRHRKGNVFSYVEHATGNTESDSEGWVRTAPKAREVRQP